MQGFVNDVLVSQSAGYSVAAIPINMSISLFKDGSFPGPGGAFVGAEIKHSWESDSGYLSDLDQILFSESLEEAPVKTGTFGGLPVMNSNGEFTTVGSGGYTNDRNTVNPIVFKKPGGSMLLFQVFLFNDARTGSNAVTMSSSGYTIKFTVDSAGSSVLIQKQGASVKANGNSSGPGKGSVTDRVRP